MDDEVISQEDIDAIEALIGACSGLVGAADAFADEDEEEE